MSRVIGPSFVHYPGLTRQNVLPPIVLPSHGGDAQTLVQWPASALYTSAGGSHSVTDGTNEYQLPLCTDAAILIQGLIIYVNICSRIWLYTKHLLGELYLCKRSKAHREAYELLPLVQNGREGGCHSELVTGVHCFLWRGRLVFNDRLSVCRIYRP